MQMCVWEKKHSIYGIILRYKGTDFSHFKPLNDIIDSFSNCVWCNDILQTEHAKTYNITNKQGWKKPRFLKTKIGFRF